MTSEDCSQNQHIDASRIEGSEIQQVQAGRDAIGFQNSHENQVTINNAIVQLFGRSQPSRIDWDWAGRIIKEQRAEVCNRLKYVLRDRAPISVQMSEQPERVNLPVLESKRRLIIARQDSELLDPRQLMIEVFGRSDIEGKLLILGTPGAGKTTVLLILAEQVLIGAIDNPKTVIPIIFELSTWKNDTQSIQDWLIEQLYDLYGGDRKLKRYEQWLEQRVLLPLLDGLDELGLERQQKCMAKLNEFTRYYPQVVVCCRSKEFEESGIRLGNLRGAIALEPLSDRQIQTYLQQVEREGLWRQIQETPEMRQMLESNDGEAGLLRVPLFVSIAAATYDQNQPFRTKGELLERYVDRQLSFDVRMSDRHKGLERRKWAYAKVEKEPTVKLTQHYLAWAARRLSESNETDFLIEKMQPTGLEKLWHRNLYRVFLAVLLTVVLWSVSGLIVALVIGLKDIKPVETLQFSMAGTMRQKISSRFKVGIIWGSVIGVLFWLVMLLLSLISETYSLLEVIVGVLAMIVMGMISGLILAIILGLIELILGFRQNLKIRLRPNQGIYNSFYIFCFSSFIGVALGILSFILFITTVVVREEYSSGIKIFFTILILLALYLIFLLGGGLAVAQHFCLRLVLAHTGTFPFLCVPFLNYCTERRLLQRIGGRYRFLHRELLDHFAQKM